VVGASLAHRETAPSLAVVADCERKPATVGGSFCTYDWANRPTAGPGVTSIVYDAEGNRIKKVAGGTTTWYLVATVNPTGYPQVVEEFTGSSPGTSTLSRVYGYGLDLLHQRQMPGNTPNFYGYDGQGSVRFLVGTNGTITDKYVYDSYGNLIPGSSSIVNTNAYRYTGEQWDADLGMYYLRARYYQPAVGRFWTRDTYEGDSSDPLSLHRYLYTQGNPVNGVDPSGHDGELAGTLTAINNLSITAATYISRVPGAARIAFGAGGAAIGRFFNQFGPVVQNFGQQVVNLFPRIESLRPALEGFSRRPDFVLKAGNALRAIEGKYQLPRAGEALTRMGSQIQQFAQW